MRIATIPGLPTTTPGFVAGTRIRTPVRAIPVEDLQIGDLVMTRDRGAQPVRWAGRTRRRAEGADAPILVSRNALGRHDPVAFSPDHKILLGTQLAFPAQDETEMLSRARYLVNGRSIRRCADGRPVTYCLILLDNHEIIWANGLPSESVHPDDLSIEPDNRAAILSTLPNATLCGFGYGPSARPVLRGYQARALIRA